MEIEIRDVTLEDEIKVGDIIRFEEKVYIIREFANKTWPIRLEHLEEKKDDN